MKWVFTITALLLIVESINLFQLIDKAKVQVIQLVCDPEKDDENTYEGKIEVKEIDKNTPPYNSFMPALLFIQKNTAYSRCVRMYISGFSTAFCQPPE